MIIGETGSGKTTCYNLLMEAIKKIGADSTVVDDRFRNIEIAVMNPKSVSLGELYGYVDPIT